MPTNDYMPLKYYVNTVLLYMGITKLTRMNNLCTDSELMNHPDSKTHGANIGPTWVMSAPDGPHVGPMNLAIRTVTN